MQFFFVDGPFEFDFVILVAGFKSRQKPHEHLYQKTITTPSLHVFGDTDKVIEKGKEKETEITSEDECFK